MKWFLMTHIPSTFSQRLLFTCYCLGDWQWIRWARHVSTQVEVNAQTIIVRKPQGKRPLGRPRFRLMILKWELHWSGVV